MRLVKTEEWIVENKEQLLETKKELLATKDQLVEIKKRLKFVNNATIVECKKFQFCWINGLKIVFVKLFIKITAKVGHLF